MTDRILQDKEGTIASFSVDHDRLVPGIYISRIDGDAVTYDLRMRRPNGGDYLTDIELHSLEHMLAVALRHGPIADRVIYVGPMGCRTGFYLVVRDNAVRDGAAHGGDACGNCAGQPDVKSAGNNDLNLRVLTALKEALSGIVSYRGSVPGAHRKECGNYRCLSLAAAIRVAKSYLDVLNTADKPSFMYDHDRADGEQ